jgi:hypothetical protein
MKVEVEVEAYYHPGLLEVAVAMVEAYYHLGLLAVAVAVAMVVAFYHLGPLVVAVTDCDRTVCWLVDYANCYDVALQMGSKESTVHCGRMSLDSIAGMLVG